MHNHPKLSAITVATLLLCSTAHAQSQPTNTPLTLSPPTTSQWVRATTPNPTSTAPAPTETRKSNAPTHVDERYIDHRTFTTEPTPQQHLTPIHSVSSSLNTPQNPQITPYTSPQPHPTTTNTQTQPSKTTRTPSSTLTHKTHRKTVITTRLNPTTNLTPASHIKPSATLQKINITRDPDSSAAFCSVIQRIWTHTAQTLQSDPPAFHDTALKTYLKIIKTCPTESEALGSAHQMTINLPLSTIEQTLATEPLDASPTQLKARYFLQTFLLYHHNESASQASSTTGTPSNPFAPLFLSPPAATQLAASAIKYNDPAPLTILAWTAQSSKAYSTAEKLFRQTLKLTPDDTKSREGLVYSLLAQNKTLATEPELARLDGDNLLNAKSATLQKQALQAFSESNYPQTLSLLASAEQHAPITDPGTLSIKAWALLKSNQAPQAQKLFQELLSSNPTSKDLSSGYVEALIANNQIDTLQSLLSNPPNGTTERINSALADHFNSQQNPSLANHYNPSAFPNNPAPLTLTPLVSSLHKTGTPGEAKLNLNSTTILGSTHNPLSSNPNATIQASASSIHLNDGISSAITHEARFSLYQPLTTDANPLVTTLELGVSRIPDALSNSTKTRPTANLSLKKYNPTGFMEATLAHEPDTSSLRSYIGQSAPTITPNPNPTLPPSTGTLFQGQAFKSSLGFNGQTQISLPLGTSPYTLTWQSSLGSLSGTNFQSTPLFNARTQLLKTISTPTFSWLAVGPELRLSTSASDQNQFTAGYAGSYAPLSESSAGARAYYLSNSSPNFILKGSTWAGLTKKEFHSSSSSSFALETDLQAAFKLNNHSSLITSLSWSNTSGFNSLSAFAGIQISLDPKPKFNETALPSHNLNFLH